MQIALQVAFPHCLPVVRHHTQKLEIHGNTIKVLTGLACWSCNSLRYSQATRTIMLRLIWRYSQKIYLELQECPIYIYIYTYFCFLESLARRPWKTTLPCSFQALATGPTPGYVERHNVLSWSGSGSKPIKLSGFTFQKTRWPDGVVGTTISRKPWQPCVSDQACIRQLAWVMVQWCAARECYRHAKTSNLNSHFHDSCNIFKFSVGIILQSN